MNVEEEIFSKIFYGTYQFLLVRLLGILWKSKLNHN